MLSKEEEDKLMLEDAYNCNFCCQKCRQVKMKDYERVIELNGQNLSVCPECEVKDKVLKMATLHGFHHEDTGGGCEALVRNFKGYDVVITSNDGCSIPSDVSNEEIEIGVYKVDEPSLWDSQPIHFETANSLDLFLNGDGLPENMEGYICDEIDKQLNIAYKNMQNFLGLSGDIDPLTDEKLRTSEGHLKEVVFHWIMLNI